MQLNKNSILDQMAILTIGFPFAAFKLLGGLAILKSLPSLFGMLIGYSLIALSLIDFIINALNFIVFFFTNRYVTEVCLLTIIFEQFKKRSSKKMAWVEFGTDLDVMLSFSLVAIVVGGNMFHYFSNIGSKLWSFSVVINVLGAGLSRTMISLMKVSQTHEADS